MNISRVPDQNGVSLLYTMLGIKAPALKKTNKHNKKEIMMTTWIHMSLIWIKKNRIINKSIKVTNAHPSSGPVCAQKATPSGPQQEAAP